MGSAISRASDPPPSSTVNASPGSASVVLSEKKKSENLHYTNLSGFDRYQEIHREADVILMPIYFEGLKIMLDNRLNERFAVLNKFTLLPVLVRLQSGLTPVAFNGFSELGVSFNHPKLLLSGKIDNVGTLDGEVKYNLSNDFSCKMMTKLTCVSILTHRTFQFEYEGENSRSRVLLGQLGYRHVDHMQNVTSNLSLGTDLTRQDERSFDIGFAARYDTYRTIASGRVSSDGSISLSFVQTLSEKVSLASFFMYRAATGCVVSVGCLCRFSEFLLRGKVDLNAVVSAYLERTVCPGTRLLVSAQIDHKRESYRFGYGLEFDRAISAPHNSTPFRPNCNSLFEGVLVSL